MPDSKQIQKMIKDGIDKGMKELAKLPIPGLAASLPSKLIPISKMIKSVKRLEVEEVNYDTWFGYKIYLAQHSSIFTCGIAEVSFTPTIYKRIPSWISGFFPGYTHPGDPFIIATQFFKKAGVTVTIGNIMPRTKELIAKEIITKGAKDPDSPVIPWEPNTRIGTAKDFILLSVNIKGVYVSPQELFDFQR